VIASLLATYQLIGQSEINAIANHQLRFLPSHIRQQLRGMAAIPEVFDTDDALSIYLPKAGFLYANPFQLDYDSTFTNRTGEKSRVNFRPLLLNFPKLTLSASRIVIA
jgi:hypothetical protein